MNFCKNMAEEDLKYEIYELKKHLRSVTSDNQMLKVKLRKYETEVERKDKQIDSLLDPKKSNCIRKIVSERGAAMIINLKERNRQLEQGLRSKDTYIKKLQTNIETIKLYSTPKTTIPYFRSQSLSLTQTPRNFYNNNMNATSDLQFDTLRLEKNLEKIKLNNNDCINNKEFVRSAQFQNNDFLSNKSTMSVDNGWCNEFTKIESKLNFILNEMEQIKQTVTHLSVEQGDAKKMLNNRNENIDTLIQQIETLHKLNADELQKENVTTPESDLEKNDPDPDDDNDVELEYK